MSRISKISTNRVFMRSLLTLLVIVATLATISQLALADRTINSVTLNGTSSVTVAPGASITAVVSVTTTGTGTATNWQCTSVRIGSGTFTGVNHGNHDTAGTFTETFTITAPAAAGTYNAQFIAFQDDFCTTGPSGILTLSSGVIVVTTASQFTLSLTKAGNGSGTVTSSPSGINCGSTCSASFTSSTIVTLTATAASGSTFSSWSGNSDCSDGSVTLDASKSCTATFNLLGQQGGIPDLSPPWMILLGGLLSLLIFRELRRRAQA